MAKDI
jgi:hypothetical protein